MTETTRAFKEKLDYLAGGDPVEFVVERIDGSDHLAVHGYECGTISIVEGDDPESINYLMLNEEQALVLAWALQRWVESRRSE